MLRYIYGIILVYMKSERFFQMTESTILYTYIYIALFSAYLKTEVNAHIYFSMSNIELPYFNVQQYQTSPNDGYPGLRKTFGDFFYFVPGC